MCRRNEFCTWQSHRRVPTKSIFSPFRVVSFFCCCSFAQVLPCHCALSSVFILYRRGFFRFSVFASSFYDSLTTMNCKPPNKKAITFLFNFYRLLSDVWIWMRATSKSNLVRRLRLWLSKNDRQFVFYVISQRLLADTHTHSRTRALR